MTPTPFVSRSMTRRRLVAGSAAAAAMLPVLRFGSVAAQEDLVVTGVTDTVGLGDQNFNDLTDHGGQRAAEEYGITWQVFESQNVADYIPNLSRAAEESALTIAIGFPLTDAVTQVAPTYPDANFMLIDSVVEEANVTSVIFKEQQGGFLAGVAAGLMAGEERTVGVVGGQRIDPVIRYEDGFRAGVMSVAPDVEVIVSYADTFGDPAKGKELTLAQYNKGANIVFSIAGRTGIGCFDAAKEKGQGFWVIAADADESHLGPEHQLCAAAKRIDQAVFDEIGLVVDGEFEGGVRNLGIRDDGIDIIAWNDAVPQNVKTTTEAYKQAIVDGVVEPPTDDESLKSFEPVPPGAVTGSAATPAS